MILHPASAHNFLDYSDYADPGDSVSALSNNPSVLS